MTARAHAADEQFIALWDQTMEAVGRREYAQGIQAALVICAANPLASASEIAAKIRLAGAGGDSSQVVPALPPDVGDEEIEVMVDGFDWTTWTG